MRKNSLSDSAMLLAGMAAGAAVMFVLDPEAGGRRRALAGQKLISGGHVLGRWIGQKACDARNRAWGWVAELRANVRNRGRDISDVQLEERVRAQLGHVISHPGGIQVSASGDGCVTITGDVLPGERAKIGERLRQTRGVRECRLNLRERSDAQNVPHLQGESRRQRKTGTLD